MKGLGGSVTIKASSNWSGFGTRAVWTTKCNRTSKVLSWLEMLPSPSLCWPTLKADFHDGKYWQRVIVLSPRPAYGGRDCPGSAFDYQMCNTEECAGPYEDFRAQQCVQRSNKYHNNVKHTWLPYEHPDGKCIQGVRLRVWTRDFLRFLFFCTRFWS